MQNCNGYRKAVTIFSFFSAPILWSLSQQQQKFAKNEMNWNDSGGGGEEEEDPNSNRRYDVVGDQDHPLRPGDVINVTPSSFSDIFIKPRIAAGMVLVKKKTEAPTSTVPYEPTSTTTTTTTTTAHVSSTPIPSTTPTHYSTTTTPLMIVQKTTTGSITVPGVDMPVLVVGPNSALSFKNVEEESETGHLLRSIGINQGSGSIQESWLQGKINNFE